MQKLTFVWENLRDNYPKGVVDLKKFVQQNTGLSNKVAGDWADILMSIGSVYRKVIALSPEEARTQKLPATSSPAPPYTETRWLALSQCPPGEQVRDAILKLPALELEMQELEAEGKKEEKT